MVKMSVVVFALLYGLPTFTPIPRESPETTAQSGSNGQQKAQANQKPSPPLPESKGAEKPISPNENGEAIATQDKREKIEIVAVPSVHVERNKPDLSDYLLAWGPWIFTLGLVIVGGLQVWLLFRTWTAIDRQARLMEFAYQAWMEIEGWRSDKKFNWLSMESQEIACYFDLINASALPLTLLKIETTVTYLGYLNQSLESKLDERRYEVTEHIRLLPKGQKVSNGYTCQVPVTITGLDEVDFQSSEYFVFFGVEVTYQAGQPERIVQHFRQLASLSPRGLARYEHSGAIPDERVTNEQDEAIK